MLEAEANSGLEGPESSRRAIEMLDRAIAIDPNYARAYALKAIIVLWLYNSTSRDPSELAMARAEALRHAQKAISIAPNLPIAHGALAEIHQSNLDLKRASAEYRRVFALQAGDPDEMRSYSRFLSNMGEHTKALQLADDALALDRLDPESFRIRGIVLYNARRYTESIKTLEKFRMESEPGLWFPTKRGDTLTMLGRNNEAREAYAEIPKEDVFRLAGEAVIAARTGDRNTPVQKIRELKHLYGDAASYQYGQIYAQLRNADGAFSALNRAWQIKDAGLLTAKVDPLLDPIRRDPQFARLLAKVGFPA